MILQNLLFPNERTCADESMFFRKDNETIVFNTYFNVFSSEKWFLYTRLRSVSLQLEAIGCFLLQIYNNETLIWKNDYCLSKRTRLDIDIPLCEDKGLIYFSFTSRTEETCLFSGAYVSKEEDLCQNINIAIDICTFKREDYLLRNLEVLKQSILENDKSPLYGKVSVYISDNGRTLDIGALQAEAINVFPNCNAGGSGGFTRGIIEILRDKERCGLTHLIFMDDDVIIEPDALIRTYAMLSLLKDEYKDSVVAGAMFRLDLRYIQHEADVVWDGRNPITSYPGLDLRKWDAVERNEVIKTSDYAAWWYACYSLDVIQANNLPLPIFIHMDDVEYGIRNNKNIILLNGICVWHESFENKRASSLNYYDIRNMLLVNAIYRPEMTCRKLYKYLLKRVGANVLRYRYKDVVLVYKGVVDYCKGIDWLMQQNPEELNKEIISLGYAMKPVLELNTSKTVTQQMEAYIKPTDPEEIYSSKKELYGKKYIYSLNGWIFPAKNDKVYAYPIGIWPYALYRKKNILLFDPDSQKGLLGTKRYKELCRCLVYYLKMIICLHKYYDKVSEEYKERFGELCELRFWEKYLKI